MDLGLRGKSAVVTGGSKGIGRAIALCFAAEGANVAICARSEDSLSETARELAKKDVRVYASKCDVADIAELDSFLEAAQRELKGIDVLVNNVAAYQFDDDEAAWQGALDVSLMPYVRATWKVVPWMRDNGGGSIVHISSIAGLEGGWPPAYAAAKAALISHSKTMALALAPSRIRVNAVTPGSIEFPGGAWDSVKRSDPKFYSSILSTVPWGRFGTPDEVADAVVFLASDRARWITGAVLTMDGGQHRGNA